MTSHISIALCSKHTHGRSVALHRDSNTAPCFFRMRSTAGKKHGSFAGTSVTDSATERAPTSVCGDNDINMR